MPSFINPCFKTIQLFQPDNRPRTLFWAMSKAESCLVKMEKALRLYEKILREGEATLTQLYSVCSHRSILLLVTVNFLLWSEWE